jgi:hypothetical protein
MRVSHTGKQQCSSTAPHDKFLHQKEQEGSFQIYGAKTATCLMACFNLKKIKFIPVLYYVVCRFDHRFQKDN